MSEHTRPEPVSGSRPGAGAETEPRSRPDGGGLVARLLCLYPVRVVRAYGDSKAGNYAAGLAFNAFMSIFPLLLGLLAIVGIAIDDPGRRAQVQSTLVGFFPGESRASLLHTLDGVHEHSGLLGAVGVAGLIWSGSSLFTAMEFALGEMIGARQRGFVRQRLMALSMTGIFAVSIVGTVLLNSLLALVGGLPNLGPLLGAVVWTGFAWSIYRFVPNRTHHSGEVWRGAVLAGILMETVSLLWPLYTQLSHGFSSYGATFALFFLLASWLYLLTQLILLGAVVNRMHEGAPNDRGLLPDVQPTEPVDTEATRAVDRVAQEVSHEADDTGDVELVARPQVRTPRSP